MRLEASSLAFLIKADGGSVSCSWVPLSPALLREGLVCFGLYSAGIKGIAGTKVMISYCALSKSTAGNNWRPLVISFFPLKLNLWMVSVGRIYLNLASCHFLFSDLETQKMMSICWLSVLDASSQGLSRLGWKTATKFLAIFWAPVQAGRSVLVRDNFSWTFCCIPRNCSQMGCQWARGAVLYGGAGGTLGEPRGKRNKASWHSCQAVQVACHADSMGWRFV